MTSKLTVYVDDSLRRMLKEAAAEGSLSGLVTDALTSYIGSALLEGLPPANFRPSTKGFPSTSEVKARRPRLSGSSADIIASQRRGRNVRVSRQ